MTQPPPEDGGDLAGPWCLSRQGSALTHCEALEGGRQPRGSWLFLKFIPRYFTARVNHSATPIKTPLLPTCCQSRLPNTPAPPSRGLTLNERRRRVFSQRLVHPGSQQRHSEQRQPGNTGPTLRLEREEGVYARAHGQTPPPQGRVSMATLCGRKCAGHKALCSVRPHLSRILGKVNPGGRKAGRRRGAGRGTEAPRTPCDPEASGGVRAWRRR